jgi:hypothetical protein
MKPDTLGRVVIQAVVHPFVVAEVEPLLLQFPFEVPVSFGDELELRMLPDIILPARKMIDFFLLFDLF